VLLILILLAAFAPLIAPYDPFKIRPGPAPDAPGALHWLGTDEVGRDLLSRIIHGTRYFLLICAVTAIDLRLHRHRARPRCRRGVAADRRHHHADDRYPLAFPTS